ncbi:MAG: YggS family pyridoxal phosphate-dependent enzyme [Bacteroidales bacterium]|jgi:pyridoxal phosphate enzyme (YggS family)|nr:YggS family pyridoxal phosphate-dependent enzyme [Bacteroidales bacterium]
MNNIVENINRIRDELPSTVQLIVVSKTKPVEAIKTAFITGQRRFGENKALELAAKNEQIPNVEWHFIGHLQTNKVKYIAPFVTMIQTVDSFRLLKEINRQAKKYNRIIDCLLEVHLAQEEEKSGLRGDEIFRFLEMPERNVLQNIRLCGLMTMATNTDNKSLIRSEFRQLADIHKQIKQRFFADDSAFCELSMGMTDDYRIAVEEGSTMVRIGSGIFKS